VGPLVWRSLTRVAGAATAAITLCSCGGTATGAGRAIFDRACAHCHTLTGHDTTANGGDLALGSLTPAEIASFTRVMPVRPALTTAETGLVARYIARAEAGG
jgi:mono/diheme cytochrome c family protein